MKDRTINRSEFDGSTSQYGNSNSLHLMKLCYAVYAGTTDRVGSKEDWTITEQLLRDAGYEWEFFEDKKGIYEPNAMIVWDNDNVFLIFRGTEPARWNQWATDADIYQQSFCIGKIHRGFANSVELLWSNIMKCLREQYVGKKKRLFIAGHSLGAGMSQVCSAKLEFEENLHPTAIYNFGSPRAFDIEGANLYNQRLGPRTYRIVNNNDIVCDLPLEIMGFSHVGRFKYIASNGELRDDPADWWLLLDGLWGGAKAIKDLKIPDIVIDHLPPSYTERLEALCSTA